MRDAGPKGSGKRPGWRGDAAAQLGAILAVGITTLLGVSLGRSFPGLFPFALYFPVVLLAALSGGAWPAATAIASSALAGWWFFTSDAGALLERPSRGVNLLLYTFSATLMAAAGVYVRTLVRRLQAGNERLADGELRYRTLFNAVTDGFSLVELVRDERGMVVDYVVREANPAMLRFFGLNRDIVGRRQSELLPDVSSAYLSACHRASGGEPVEFEWRSPAVDRWYAVRLSRIADDQIAQIVQDVTDRKTAEARHTELFDELNHRMKNNLAMVSAMLSLQARIGEEPAIRSHLLKAVDRIQAIADVHASLYRGSRKDDVDFAAYLQDLCGRLAGSLLETDRVKLQVQAEPAIMPLDRAVALGVVVNELVTNAAKYAYPPPTEGIIDVKLEHQPQSLVLSIGDSGAGLPAEPSNTGLGMRLVRSLVQQIGATLEVEHHPGATFRVRLPELSVRSGAAAGQARLF